MSPSPLSRTDYWRAIVLYGLNTATYKIALAAVLGDLAGRGLREVAMHDVAIAFFLAYRRRLEGGHPQQVIPGRKTVLERIVADHTAGRITEDEAVARVERQGFNDVVRRFHVVNGGEIGTRFYAWTGSRITHLTDDLLRLFEGEGAATLRGELEGRWGLLEVAFETRLPTGTLDADEREFFRREGARRTSVTATRPVLTGYQNGRCFYCGEVVGDRGEVDHVIPWSAVRHDQIWNLVLSCRACNQDKRALLPPQACLAALARRNEYYIASNHPIKPRRLEQMGATVRQRRGFLRERYREAEAVTLHRWHGPRRIALDHDPLGPLGLVLAG